MKFNLLSANQYCEAITDGTHDSPPYFNEGYPLVTSKCLKNGHIDLSIAPLISKQDYELINIRSMVKSNDILISMIGTVGEVALVGDELPFAIKNVGLFRSRNQIDAKYLSYYLLSAPATEYIRKSSTGSTQQYITLSKLKDFPILEPNNQEDKQHIVDILGSIDKRIENNIKIAAKLEQLAMALYKNNFYNSDIDTELVCLSDFATFDSGYSYSSQELVDKSDTGMLTIKNFERCGGFKIDGYKPIIIGSKAKSTIFAFKNDVLVAHTDVTQNADIIGNPILVHSTADYERVIYSTDLVKVSPSSYLSRFMIYAILRDDKYIGYAKGFCTGTTVLHMGKKALPGYCFELPTDKNMLAKLDCQLTSIYSKISEVYSENALLDNLKASYLQHFFG